MRRWGSKVSRRVLFGCFLIVAASSYLSLHSRTILFDPKSYEETIPRSESTVISSLHNNNTKVNDPATSRLEKQIVTSAPDTPLQAKSNYAKSSPSRQNETQLVNLTSSDLIQKPSVYESDAVIPPKANNSDSQQNASSSASRQNKTQLVNITTSDEIKEASSSESGAEIALTASNSSTQEHASSLDALLQQDGEAKNESDIARISDATVSSLKNSSSWVAFGDESPDYLEPWTNVTTVGFAEAHFVSGFRNQIMSFTCFVMLIADRNYSQILLQTIRHKDLHGSNKLINFQDLFDVEHWNSYYPQLPRMVRCDPELFTDFNCEGHHFRAGSPEIWNLTRPHALGRQYKLQNRYFQYSKRRGELANQTFPNPVHLLILNGALRPHHELRTIVDGIFESSSRTAAKEKLSYMTLHARVEPDMQVHTKCRDKKVLSLSKIFQDLETKFPEPPAPIVFMPINRALLEKEGNISEAAKNENPESINDIAVSNLQTLNRAVKDGLWNGTVKVIECGGSALKGTRYEKRAATTGALLDFFISRDAKIFVGTEVSSFSHDLTTTRFYRGNKLNYYYRPDGISEWTTEETEHPDGFRC